MIAVWAFAGLFLGFLIAAAICDGAAMRIPNRLTAAMAALGPVASWAVSPGVGALSGVILTGAVVLAIGWAMFELGWWGGGDAKLVTAASLWLGAGPTVTFVLATAIFGALLAAGLLILARWTPRVALQRPRLRALAEAERLQVPYAIAMVPAGAVALLSRFAGLV